MTNDRAPDESVEHETDLAPQRLVRCEVCGELRGTGLLPDVPAGATAVTLVCLCDGLVCRHCGEGRIHRPISSHYDDETGTVWHTPSFMYLARCRACGARDWVDADPDRALRLRHTRPEPESFSKPSNRSENQGDADGEREGRVSLFAGTLPSGITSYADAYINDQGDLVVAVQDLGPEVERLFGDSDYEWWVVVQASDRPKLLERLMAEQSRSAALTAGAEDAVLLSLLEDKFAGRPSASAELEEWLTANGIAFKRSVYI
jgi:hypothetical protein